MPLSGDLRSSRVLLIGAGAVTVVPLILFGFAARNIRLADVGFVQYIAPTFQFLIGVFVFKEPFEQTQLVGFGLVWLALFIFGIEGWIALKKTNELAKEPV